MFTLIKNELYKIFHKKSTYIVLIITILFSVLVTVIYNSDVVKSSYYNSYSYLDQYQIKYYQDYVDNFNPNGGDYNELVNAKASLDIYNLLQKYDD